MPTAGCWRTVTAPAAACAAERRVTPTGPGSEPKFSVVPADYGVDHAAIRRVRFAVFVDEQAVPAELEMDERDAACFHVLAKDAAGLAVGTGRIDLDDGGRVGRMAVLRPWRSCGVGSQIIAALHAHARSHGCRRVWCHAQVAARRFYERAGYVARGNTFQEAGIEHVTMHCVLEP